MFQWIQKIGHRDVVHNLYEDATFSESSYLLLLCSAIIATLGLIMNNSAIVIGAMIIAPLMWPIVGISMASVLGHGRRLVRFSWSICTGVSLSIGTAMLITFILPFALPTDEIVLRTSPTILDLIIALASGAVAAMSVSWPRISGSVAGVAVSTSLLPPLCAVGFGIAKGTLGIAFGAFLLFLSNFVAILFAGMVLFRLTGFHETQGMNGERNELSKGSIVVVLGALIGMAIPLGYFLYDTVAESNLREDIRSQVETYFTQNNTDIEIQKLALRSTPASILIDIEAAAEEQVRISSKEKEQLIQELNRLTKKEITLEMTILNYIHAGAVTQEDTISKQVNELQETLEERETRLREELMEQFSEIEDLKGELEQLKLQTREDIQYLPSVERFQQEDFIPLP